MPRKVRPPRMQASVIWPLTNRLKVSAVRAATSKTTSQTFLGA